SLLIAQNEGALVTENFGQAPETGSFRVAFSKQSAGIIWLQATDHYVSVEAANEVDKQTRDNLLLIDNPISAMRLFQAQASGSQASGSQAGMFAKDPSNSDWDMQRT